MPTSSVAAVDLGSNSFHLVVAQVADGEVRVVDKLRERVQLAAGLDGANRLGEGAQMRALACLQRIGQRLAAFAPSQVRAVGTNTLRRAVNGATFRALAEAALGHPIEVVDGQEEARLVYLGVTHGQDDGGARRLVVDIGGGSTECIVGVGEVVEQADSLQMGCVSWSQRFFPRGRITADLLDEAIVAARLELGPIHRSYRSADWRAAHGSSGTINAIGTLLQDNGWAHNTITEGGLEALREALITAGHVDDLDMPGLRPDRREVLPGGFAVLAAVFRSLKIREMHAAKGALREGVLYDLIGRAGSQDVREPTVRRMQARFEVDRPQADRVEAVAMQLLDEVAEGWSLDKTRARPFLGWAAALHEVGRAISFSGYHKHGAYLVQHAHMPGFSYRDHALLAALVLCHRRKLNAQRILDIGCGEVELALRLAVLLRLSVRLNRTRSPAPPPALKAEPQGDGLHLEFPPGWLAGEPLTRAGLHEEAQQLDAAGVQLTWS